MASRDISKKRPIAHLIPREYNASADSDSSLKAAGGFSTTMKFWWYLEWPQEVQNRTLLKLKDNKKGMLISINALEYATVLIIMQHAHITG